MNKIQAPAIRRRSSWRTAISGSWNGRPPKLHQQSTVPGHHGLVHLLLVRVFIVPCRRRKRGSHPSYRATTDLDDQRILHGGVQQPQQQHQQRDERRERPATNGFLKSFFLSFFFLRFWQTTAKIKVKITKKIYLYQEWSKLICWIWYN